MDRHKSMVDSRYGVAKALLNSFEGLQLERQRQIYQIMTDQTNYMINIPSLRLNQNYTSGDYSEILTLLSTGLPENLVLNKAAITEWCEPRPPARDGKKVVKKTNKSKINVREQILISLEDDINEGNPA